MITIADTPQYHLAVSPAKNRAYLRIIGFWRSPEQVENYITDWQKAVAALKPGFTLLTDAREMKIHPASVRALHEQAQALIVSKGVLKVAELQQDAIAEMQLNAVAGETQMPKQNFQDPVAAERWLDSIFPN
ncbi:hypothetical protein [Cesiribacter andamanensis]|uniref:STAS/SEC14 domain-containing protein n=1 Tax=Cesiribacter andamanensis AMV16 TaxID=1279009 RepID=M7NYJ3_9BACT|nr:hypothetical protein [Cesiribacter andamanensis]EMR03464.1 hypothetical protein ADICEAN_01397 [Cesiribacter andamanensis AMV16]